MKKTRLFLLLSFLLCLLAITACADMQTTAPDTTEAVGTTVDPLADFTVETVRDDFYLNVDYAPPVELFQDTASFLTYAEQALLPYENLEEYADKYDDAFFETRGVAVLYLKMASESYRPYLASFEINEDGSVSIAIGRRSPQTRVMDRAGFRMFISFPKSTKIFKNMTKDFEYLPLEMLDDDEFYALYPPVTPEPDPDAVWKSKVESIKVSGLSLNYIFSEAFKTKVEVKDGALGIMVYLNESYRTSEQFDAFMNENGIEGSVFISKYADLQFIHTYVKNAEELKRIASHSEVTLIAFNYINVND